MASSENVIQVEMNTQAVAVGIKEVSGAVGGLKKTVSQLGAALKSAFAWSEVTAYLKNAAQSGEKLDKELLVLRLSLGKLKAAIGQAIAPLAAAFIPIIQQAVWSVTRLVRAVGKVIGALFGGSDASERFEKQTQAASKAQNTLAKSSAKVKRSLAGFDEITRLAEAPGGGSSIAEEITSGKVTDTLSPQLQAIVDKIQSLLEPIKQISFAPAIAAFGKLREALTPISRELFSGLEWAWHNLLVPLAAWTVEDLLPAFLELLSGALQVLNGVIIALKPMASWLWENFLKPIAQWTGDAIIDGLHWMTEKLEKFSGWIAENQSLVQALVVLIGGLSAAIALANSGLSQWNLLGGAATQLTSGFSLAVGALSSPVKLVCAAILALISTVVALGMAWDDIKAKTQEVWNGIQRTWGNAGLWFRERLFVPLEKGFKNMVNGVIGFINGLLVAAAKGLNGLVDSLNRFRVQIPSWIPGLGGKTFGFAMERVKAPQIPYLARGAVLPANRPFMAVVGDQRHGTNIEAPLATIQEAVAMVMGDQTAAIMAGFESSVGVQREILQAVLGIQIGDDVIGQAVSRYQRRLATVRGG